VGIPAALNDTVSREEREMMKRVYWLPVLCTLFFAGVAGADDYPIMDMVADKVVQKYQTSSCEDLWKQKGAPKTDREKEALQLLRDDPQMRTAFVDKVAATVVNKMFECGMIP
jgi:hypothetical protein